jgi:hypothetical protein
LNYVVVFDVEIGKKGDAHNRKNEKYSGAKFQNGIARPGTLPTTRAAILLLRDS